ncbi:hypothetical protein BJ970_004940 [Saccharopolyspora phatthalungensis]|uniref:DUF3040 domain-containing protein n=1 Tax=Saccharopolyspora phatthalungensis TaxID=664693 RepID=A0A840QAG5_9PSEU|nr:hypothetical protein [Saccharopolyspora phatthalungensis]
MTARPYRRDTWKLLDTVLASDDRTRRARWLMVTSAGCLLLVSIGVALLFYAVPLVGTGILSALLGTAALRRRKKP